MIKSSILGLAMLAMASTTALASHVYTNKFGQWAIDGYMSDSDRTDVSCVIATYWEDGSEIKINIFPHAGAPSDITMSITDVAWDNTGYTIDQSFPGKVVLYKEDVPHNFTGNFNIHGVNSVLVKDLSKEFLISWLHGDYMVIFPNTPSQLVVGLSGTKDAILDYINCESAVTNIDENE